jgi:peptide/nickel transport system substrate-binding protein
LEQPSGPDTLDPASSFVAPALEADQQVYQGLVAYAPNSTAIVPLIAQNYTVSSDGLTYSFWMRQNVVFSNGDPVNAYVVWYSEYRTALMAQATSYFVTLALNTTLGGVTAGMLNSLNGSNNIPPASLLQVMQNPKLAITVTGPYSLQFHLMTPFSAFLATQTEVWVVDPRIVAVNGGVVAGQPNPWMTNNVLGTGPFTITQFVPNTITVYQKNTNYWGGANGVQPTPHLDKVIAKVVPNALTRLEDVARASAQVAYVDFTLAPQIAGTAGAYIPKLGPEPTVQYLSFNTQRFPFNNTMIRQATAHAINLTGAVSLFSGFGTSYVGPVPKGLLGYDYSLKPYSYNLTLAKQLLTKAGHPNGQGIPPVSMIFPTDRPPASLEAQFIQAALGQIGITVKLQGMTDSQEYNILSSNAPTNSTYPNLSYDNWFNVPDPWGYANWLVGPLNYGPSNEAYYNNAQVNALFKQADSTTNQTQRAVLYQNAAKLVYNDSPYIWVGQFQNAASQGIPVATINLRGFVPSFQFFQSDFSTIYLIP